MTNIWGENSVNTFNSITIGNPSYTLPTSDGSSGYQLTTDGKGTVSWSPAESGSGSFTNITVSGTSSFSNTITCRNINAGTNSLTCGSATISSMSCSSLTSTLITSTQVLAPGTSSVTTPTTNLSVFGSMNVYSSVSNVTDPVISYSSISFTSPQTFFNTVGYEFVANANLVVQQLLLNVSAYGSGPVGIYNTSGTLLTSSNVTVSNPTSGQFNYATISGITLSSGQTYMVVCNPLNSIPQLTGQGTATSDSNISISGYVSSNPGSQTTLQFPIGFHAGSYTYGNVCGFKYVISSDILNVSTSGINCGTYSATCGSLSVSSLLSSGTISCGTNGLTCGSLSSGAINCGTNSLTCGSSSVTSLLSSGTISCGTNGLTCGSLSSGAINAGTNALTCGSASVTSLLSSGTISCGTNGLTCGSLSSGAINAGTNALTCGSASVTSLTSSGTMSCGTNAFTCSNITPPAGSLFVLSSNNGSSTNFTSMARIGLTSGATDTNIYGVSVSKGGIDMIALGVNKNSVTGALPSEACFITSYNTNSVISIGRGSGTGLMSTSDILIGSTGAVSMTNGLLSCSSISAAGTFTCGTNAMTAGALSISSLTSSGTMSCGTNAMTAGALSCAAITSSGTISCGTNAMTCGAISCSSIIGTADAFTITSNNGSPTNGHTAFDINVSSPSAGNLYGMGIFRQGVDAVFMGINKSTTTGSIPGSAIYISSYGSGSTICIGRGGNNDGPSTSDILIGSTGAVSMTNGLLSCSSISASGTFTCGTNALTCGLTYSNNTYTQFLNVATSSQSITTGSAQPITIWRTTASVSVGTAVTCDGTYLSFPIKGIWKVSYSVIWPGNASGYRETAIYKNALSDGVYWGVQSSSGNSNENKMSGGAEIQFNALDSCSIVVTQNTGGSLTIGPINPSAMYFTASLIQALT